MLVKEANVFSIVQKPDFPDSSRTLLISSGTSFSVGNHVRDDFHLLSTKLWLGEKMSFIIVLCCECEG